MAQVEIRVPSLSELNEHISEAIKKEVKKHADNLLHRIAQGENLNFDLIKEKYGALSDINISSQSLKIKKKKINSIDKCQARVSAGDRCSRKCKHPDIFCGGHINSRPYGVISQDSQSESEDSEGDA